MMCDLAENRIEGSLPRQLLELGSLTWLTLSTNQLTGTISTAIRSLTKLRALSFGKNKLTGSLPEEMFGLLQLESLILNENAFNGTLSQRLSSLKSLRECRIDRNNLSGTVPLGMGKLIQLELRESARNPLATTAVELTYVNEHL